MQSALWSPIWIQDISIKDYQSFFYLPAWILLLLAGDRALFPLFHQWVADAWRSQKSGQCPSVKGDNSVTGQRKDSAFQTILQVSVCHFSSRKWERTWRFWHEISFWGFYPIISLSCHNMSNWTHSSRSEWVGLLSCARWKAIMIDRSLALFGSITYPFFFYTIPVY